MLFVFLYYLDVQGVDLFPVDVYFWLLFWGSDLYVCSINYTYHPRYSPSFLEAGSDGVLLIF